MRSVYAVTDGARLWWRAYVSSRRAPDETLRLYLFVDSDRDATTGGSAAASAIEPAFVSDPTDGGYEHVFGISGDGMVIDVWDHRAAARTISAPDTGAAAARAGRIRRLTDPLILRGDVHGYVSGR